VDSRVINILADMKYKVIVWNVDSDDWRMESESSSYIADHVTNLFGPRSSRSYILLQHDTVQSSVEAQRAIIKDLKAKGYKFGNISECLGNVSVYR